MDYNDNEDCKGKLPEEQFMSEEEYKRSLILGHFSKDGLILIISNIIICVFLLIIFFIYLNNL